MAVRVDGAAGVLVGIDERRQLDGCLEALVQAEADAEKMAAMFKALSDPVRLRLFSKVASHEGGEACVCDIQDVGVSQPTVSHHLKKLREAWLLTTERRVTWVYYQVAPSVVAAMSAMLDLRS